jgi:tripartite-type tricarboxylate transporter receptor subunit TctC
MKRVFFAVTASLIALILAAPAAVAQNYPAKTVRVIIPWPPGGSNDITARIVFQKISANTGQQFVIDNRGGAGGTIGADTVAKSAPDGYTIMVHSAAHITNAHLYKKLPYDTLNDFIGVTPLATQVGMLVVHPSMPAKNVRELIAIAKARPGQVTYGSSGNGSFVHLSMALFASMTNTKMIHVPYKGGGPATIALVSGEIQAMIATVGSVLPHVKAKRVRPLGVTSEKRSKALPDIPTIAEAGVPGYEFTAWIAVFVPAKTPRPIVDRLNAEIKKALENPDVEKSLSAQTLDPLYMTPEQFARRLQSDYETNARLVKLTGAKLE